jgi:hypothetical protein
MLWTDCIISVWWCIVGLPVSIEKCEKLFQIVPVRPTGVGGVALFRRQRNDIGSDQILVRMRRHQRLIP